MKIAQLLLVDDEPAIRLALRDYFEVRGYSVREAEDGKSALDSLVTEVPDAVVLDYHLPDGDALSLLPRLRQVEPLLPVVILTGHGTIDLAVRALQEGADHFLTKPVQLPALELVLERVIQNTRHRRKDEAAQRKLTRNEEDPFIGESAAIRSVEHEARLASETDSPVLITGETGTGKGVLARWLHRHGTRSDEAFVDINCAGLEREFLESELFGHERGAFTGAVAPKPGLFEVAHRGTMFLDEIGDVDPTVQPKLLKVIEEKRFRRLGDVRDRRSDVRFVAATHQDLPALIREKRFRADLFYRINALPIALPPLSRRGRDVLDLSQRILADLSHRRGVGLSSDAEERLLAHKWPGNIRELRNVLERALLLSRGGPIGVAHLQFHESVEGSAASPGDVTLAELERQHIGQVLAEEGGRVDAAARRLGIPRSTLYARLRRTERGRSRS